MSRKLPSLYLERASIVRLMICKQCLSARSSRYKVFAGHVVCEQGRLLESFEKTKAKSFSLCLFTAVTENMQNCILMLHNEAKKFFEIISVYICSEYC